MQIVCERDALARELSRVAGVVPSKVQIPILGFVHLQAFGESLEIRANNTEMEALTICSGDVGKPGATCVDGKVFSALIRKCQDGSKIALTLDDARMQLKIVSGRSRFSLPVLPAEDFPSLEVFGADGHEFIVEAAELRKLLNSVRFAMSTESTRYYLKGVYFHSIEEKLRMVATDGHRLAVRDMALPAGASKMPGVILPRNFIHELLRIMPDEGEVALEVFSSMIIASWGEAKLISKLIDGTYPDYNRMIPDPEHRILVDRKRMIEAVGRTSIVLEAKGRSGIDLVLGAAGLTVQAKSEERGQGMDEIDALIEGPQIILGMNFRYLLDQLASIETDTVELRYSDASSPMLFRPEGADAEVFRVVLMPMLTDAVSRRLKEAA